jgi:uncharacterized protein YndB with AHSA1/START domain
MSSPTRTLAKQVVTSVPLEIAWNTWTTDEGIKSFFAPKTNVDLRQGGPFELFFDLKAPRGFQGTEGCKVLGVDVQKSLAFEFLAPPQFPNVRRVHTRVDLVFENVLSGGLVKVKMAHSGFQEGEEWDECYDFFNWSWDLVLGRFQSRFYNGPIDWSHPYMPQGVAPRPQRKLRDKVPS